jgi:hypothetical protein
MRILKYLFLFIVIAYASFVSYLHFYKDKGLSEVKEIAQEDEITPLPDKEVTKDTEQKSENFSRQELEHKDVAKKAVSKKEELSKTKNGVQKEEQKKIPKDAIVITLPKVPKVEAKVPQVVTIGGSKIEPRVEKRLSTAMPVVKKDLPIKKEMTNSKQDSKKGLKATKEVAHSTLGLENMGRISTYLRAKLIEKEQIIAKLKSAGFTIIADEYLDPKKELEVIVVSNKYLKELAKRSPYLSNIRVLIDKKNRELSITNPYYFAKAYMGKSFDAKLSKEALESINSLFSEMKASKEKLKSSLLPEYHFMFGMPYYKDMLEVGSGNHKALLKKVHSKKARVAFVQELGKDTALIGLKLSPKVGSFIDIVGVNNALLLPYPIMIKGNNAYILDPKYYIAISYPLLKMSQFMKISDIPDAITAEAKNLFK